MCGSNLRICYVSCIKCQLQSEYMTSVGVFQCSLGKTHIKKSGFLHKGRGVKSLVVRPLKKPFMCVFPSQKYTGVPVQDLKSFYSYLTFFNTDLKILKTLHLKKGLKMIFTFKGRTSLQFLTCAIVQHEGVGCTIAKICIYLTVISW